MMTLLARIKTFNAALDLGSAQSVLARLQLSASDVHWISQKSPRDFTIETAFLGVNGALVYLGPRDSVAPQLLFLIEKENAPLIARASLAAAFGTLERQRSRAARKLAGRSGAGAYVARETPNDIVFVSEDIDAEELAITGIFFMHPAAV